MTSTPDSDQVPVGVFVGGTSGIGQGMAEVFAEQTQGKCHIVIVGRNRAAAEAILYSIPLQLSSTTYTREFVECDATLMQNVDHASKEILAKHPKINYLVLTCGFSSMNGRDETPEGIDRKLAVHYYARWKFIGDLLPAVQRSKAEGEDAVVMSVMAAGYGGEIDTEDLGLKKTFSVSKAALVAPTYNDLMMESYAAKAPSVAFMHAHPGFVRTNYMAASRSPLLRALSPLLLSPYSPVGLLMRGLSTSHTQTGEYMWKAIREAAARGPASPLGVNGAWRTGAKGEDKGMQRYFGNAEQREKLWTHTEEEMRRALGVKHNQA